MKKLTWAYFEILPSMGSVGSVGVTLIISLWESEMEDTVGNLRLREREGVCCEEQEVESQKSRSDDGTSVGRHRRF